nr:hypothetical protein [Tanacetum cinerariifolium]
MNNKKRIVNLEYFREMLHICPIIPNQTFDELLFEEEILANLRYLGHGGEIKKITDRNKVNWHYVRDDQVFTMIKLVLRHQNTQQFGAMLPVELTNKDIKNFAAYKEYYAFASRAAPPKIKSSMRKMQSSFNTTLPPLTAACTRLLTSAKGKQPAKSSKAKEFVCVISVCYEHVQPSPDAGIDSLFELAPQVDVPVTTTVVPLLVTAPTLPPPSIPI